MEVTQADAYREACIALGEAVVAQRLTAAHAARLEAENADLHDVLQSVHASEQPTEPA